MMSFFFISLYFCYHLQLNSQVVNIENRRIYDDTSGFSGSIDAAFSAVQNKNLLLSGSFRPRVQYKSKKHYFLFLTDWMYTKGENQVYANSGMIHFRYAYRLKSFKDSLKKSPWKWESYAQMQYNQLLDQRLRALFGTGLRVKVLDKSGYRIFVGTSTFFEYEDIQSSEITHRDYRWSNYLSWYFNPKPSFSFTAVTYFQPLWKDLNDFRFMGQYTLNFNVFKRTDFRFEFNTFYDSNPPIEIRNWIFNTSIGVKIRLGE
ncbi:MAG: DUF481 domain-containing protein [Crocinitomicaceae bacterium]|nr:DUF481 domain-containing protein [Crocinitomicaceae bacterium]